MQMPVPKEDPNAMDVVSVQPQASTGQDSEHPQESFNMTSMSEDGEDDVA
jgi:hypothetical protein